MSLAAKMKVLWVQPHAVRKVTSCFVLLLFSVSATLCTELSRSNDGDYPYNTFMIPCAVEGLKLFSSATILVFSSVTGQEVQMKLSLRRFLSFCLPALCYFVSNNCMFYIIKDLGPTTFQILNNLKVLFTGMLMFVFLGRKLSWLRWKALILLVIGSMVTQLEADSSLSAGTRSGYFFVLLNSAAAGAGGVMSELLLKGGKSVGDVAAAESIHWQNCQLYFFGFLFGMLSLLTKQNSDVEHPLAGFNFWAVCTVVSLTMCGLMVSFILKYLDNFAKCFVQAVSMILVTVGHASTTQQSVPLRIGLGIALVCLAIEQYSLPQATA